MTQTSKLTVLEKVGYSLGDLAANLIFQTLMTFLAFFYTDVYQIPASSAAVIIFVGGMIGAFFNPVMGMIADRTQSKWGKFRPWILWTAVPFGVAALMVFSVPDFTDQGKIGYALITYIILVLIYSANNLPYAALSGVLTGDMAERNSLSSYRFVAVMVAQFIIQALLLPLVLIFGDGDKAAGFQNVMTFFAIVGVVFFLITFITTKERIQVSEQQQGSIKQDLVDLFKNQPWLVMLVATILIFVTLALKGGMYIYYFQNFVSEAAINDFMAQIGFYQFIAGLNSVLTYFGFVEFHWPDDAATSGFSLFNALGIIFMIFGIGFSKPLADKYGKRDVFGFALLISTLFLIAFYWFSPDDGLLIFTASICHGFFYGITIPLLWAMIADVADYSEWKNNRRATAIVFSAMIFGLKAGLSIGGALVAYILAFYQYDAALAMQSESTIGGILLSVSVFASLPFLSVCALLFFYPINKTTEVQIESELKLRRKTSTI